jgi:hypothetical protein
MQRNFEPMRKQVEAWQKSELTDVMAKVFIYEAFVEGRLEAPKHLARSVRDLYFEPKYKDSRSRAIWSLSNAFASAFKELEPIPQFKARAKLGEFLEARFSQSFWFAGQYRPTASFQAVIKGTAQVESAAIDGGSGDWAELHLIRTMPLGSRKTHSSR